MIDTFRLEQEVSFMIRLKKAIMYPYRCIETTQELDLSKNIIALVGRNEAGKTSALELLAKSNYYNTRKRQVSF